ncbi:hypothetical protein GBA52_009203 [Prunus armeniaca]|nr:hypothetical protein GBA52_009203 [Prunus armeniaca]
MDLPYLPMALVSKWVSSGPNGPKAILFQSLASIDPSRFYVGSTWTKNNKEDLPNVVVSNGFEIPI